MKKNILLLFITLFFISCASKNEQSLLKSRYNPQNSGKAPQFLDVVISQDANDLEFFPYKIKLDENEFLKNIFNAWVINPNEDKKHIFWSNFANGFDENAKQISSTKLKNLYDNENQEDFLKVSKKAITTDIVNIRVLLTLKPLFANKNDAMINNFDELSNSTIGAFSPVFISHYSKDKKFAFVKTDAFWGFVQSDKLLILNENEAQKFKNYNFAVFIKDDKNIQGAKFKSRLGGIFPYTNENSKNFIFKDKISDKNFNFIVPKNIGSHFLQINDKNLKMIANELIGQKYGWGGMHNLRDCSLFIKDFFAVFAKALPRNSQAQGKVANKISIKNLSNKEKIAMLNQKGLFFTTLLLMPGHIMLWAGNTEALHNSWSIKTNDESKKSIIGKTAITDMQVAKGYDNVDEEALLINKISSFNVIIDPKKIALERAYNVKIDKDVHFADGFSIPFDNQKESKKSKFSPSTNASVADILASEYAIYQPLNSPLSDAGRIRAQEFFKHIYGANKDEVSNNLIPVKWLPSSLNEEILFNSKNGAAAALQRVSFLLDELSQKNPQMLQFLNQSGTFVYRKIAKSNDLSAHSWGIAIDINVKNSTYWQWHKQYKNSLPFEIVKIFEENGFIWGGRWEHFDTMHFEYRPEFMMLEKLQVKNIK